MSGRDAQGDVARARLPIAKARSSVDERAFAFITNRSWKPGGYALPVRAAAGLEAVAAVNRLVATRLERYFGRLSALAARGLEHFATAAASRSAAAAVASATAARAALRLTRRSAFRAAIRLILEALARKKLLLAGTKNELAVTINAAQGFVSVHLRVFPGV